jgi:ABC-type antimicrobial peptide transport system permease subunit
MARSRRLVLTSAVRVVGIGATIGLIVAALSSRLIVTMLFGVAPLDVTTFGLVTVVLALTAAFAIAGPAWRAATIDPAIALRSK